MGFTYVTVTVAAPDSPQRGGDIELLVDTGATLSVIPRPLLERLGITPVYTQKARVFGGAVLEVMGLRVDPRSGQLERIDILMLSAICE